MDAISLAISARQAVKPSDGFTEFYASQFDAVRRYVRPMLSCDADAMDVAQDAFERAFPRWRRLQAYDNPAAWVRLVATRLAISRQRRAAVMSRILGSWATSRDEADVATQLPDWVLLAAMRRLPRRQQEILALRYFADWPLAEIAIRLGVTENVVRARLARARQRLATMLDGADRDG